jgi:hypothetical protein
MTFYYWMKKNGYKFTKESIKKLTAQVKELGRERI